MMWIEETERNTGISKKIVFLRFDQYIFKKRKKMTIKNWCYKTSVHVINGIFILYFSFSFSFVSKQKGDDDESYDLIFQILLKRDNANNWRVWCLVSNVCCIFDVGIFVFSFAKTRIQSVNVCIADRAIMKHRFCNDRFHANEYSNDFIKNLWSSLFSLYHLF